MANSMVKLAKNDERYERNHARKIVPERQQFYSALDRSRPRKKFPVALSESEEPAGDPLDDMSGDDFMGADDIGSVEPGTFVELA